MKEIMLYGINTVITVSLIFIIICFIKYVIDTLKNYTFKVLAKESFENIINGLKHAGIIILSYSLLAVLLVILGVVTKVVIGVLVYAWSII